MRIVEVTCDRCHGSGRLPRGESCERCERTGVILLASPARGVYLDLDGRAVDCVDLAEAAGLDTWC
jgi:hypothetical protein